MRISDLWLWLWSATRILRLDLISLSPNFWDALDVGGGCFKNKVQEPYRLFSIRFLFVHTFKSLIPIIRDFPDLFFIISCFYRVDLVHYASPESTSTTRLFYLQNSACDCVPIWHGIKRCRGGRRAVFTQSRGNARSSTIRRLHSVCVCVQEKRILSPSWLECKTQPNFLPNSVNQVQGVV